MKKNLFYVASLAVAMLFAACSSNEELAVNEKPIKDAFNEDGTATLRLNIAAPVQSGDFTRGVTDEIGSYGDNYGQFNDGEKYEHTVESAVLVLFKGKDTESELNFTLHSAYELKNTNWSMKDSNPQVTKTGAIVTKIQQGELENDEKLYALILLNKHEYFTVDGINLKNQAGTVLNGKPASVLRDQLLDEKNRNFAAQAFFMSNMPYTKVGGGTTPPTGATTNFLYPINPESIYSNETDALLGDATTTVNVERALAKVSVTSSSANVTTEDSNHSTGKILGWFIDNTNPSTYVVRHCQEPVDGTYAKSEYGYLQYLSDNATTYRFVAKNPVVDQANHKGEKYYRTFWGIDPNYNAPADDLVTEQGKVVENWTMTFNPNGTHKDGRLRPVGSYYYCTENTFDIKHQTEYNTTRVVVAIQFNNGQDFYTINPGETGEILPLAELKARVLQLVLERVTALQWLEEYLDKTKVTNYPDDVFDVTVDTDEAKGTATVAVVLKALQPSWLKSEKTIEGARGAWDLQYDQNWLNKNYAISYYKSGVAYYSALIKHFGDVETPWTEKSEMQNNTGVNGVYGTSSKNFLGRYGVVRNNWYKVNITGVRTIGSSVVPPLSPEPTKDVPDDQVNKYIKVEINITPWAIRYQDTKL